MQSGSPFPNNLLVQKGKESPELNCLPVEHQFQQELKSWKAKTISQAPQNF